MTERGCKIRCPQPQKFLPHIEDVAVLGGEAASGRYAFYIGQQHTPCGDGKQLFGFDQPKGRNRKGRETLGNFARDGHSQGWQPKHRGNQNRQRHDADPDRPARQESLTEKQEQDGNGTDGQHQQMRVAKLTGKPDRAIRFVPARKRHRPLPARWQMG
jgi:hypothetical protein